MQTSARVRARVAGVLLTSALALTACGGHGSSTNADSGTPAPSTSPKSPTSPTSSASTRAGGSSHGADPTSGGRLVRVLKYGISYRVPPGWLSVDGKALLRPDNPVLTQVANHLGMSVDQLITAIGNNILAYSVSDAGATGGVLDTVNLIGIPVSGVTGDQIRVQLASIGAKPGKAVSARTPVGQVTRLPYVWDTNGHRIYGVSMAVDLGTSTAQITVSAHNAPSARSIADLVQGSLQKLT
jgi:hypothetical protein